MRDVDAAADDDGLPTVRKPLAFQKDTDRLTAADQNIVRPLDLDGIGVETAETSQPVACTERCDERQIGKSGHRSRIDQEKRRVEISTLGNPCTPAPPPAGRLAFGGDPQGSGITGAGRLEGDAVGRPDLVERQPPDGG